MGRRSERQRGRLRRRRSPGVEAGVLQPFHLHSRMLRETGCSEHVQDPSRSQSWFAWM